MTLNATFDSVEQHEEKRVCEDCGGTGRDVQDCEGLCMLCFGKGEYIVYWEDYEDEHDD